MDVSSEVEIRNAGAGLEHRRQGVAVQGFAGAKHAAEKEEGIGEAVDGGEGSDEGVVEEGGLAVGDGEDDGCFV